VIAPDVVQMIATKLYTVVKWAKAEHQRGFTGLAFSLGEVNAEVLELILDLVVDLRRVSGVFVTTGADAT
jgi:hypothetical protein